MADNEALSRMRYKAKKKKKNPKETGASLLQSGSSILSSASKGKNTASQATKTRNGKVAGVKQVSRNNSKSKKTTTPSSRQYQTALVGKKSLPIIASDAAKKAHENTMDTSPMGQLRRQGKRIQTSRTDNFNREENDSALPSGLASNLRNAQRKKNKTALSKADRKNLSKPEQLYLRSQKEAWESGQKLIERGYTEQGKQMQEEAHARAESIRRDSGYSGGDSGAGFITPEIKQDEYAGMSDAGRKNLRVAKSYYNYGKETGDKGLMDDAAEYGKAVRLDPASYDLERALAWEKKQKDVAPERPNTDGNGRTIYTPTEWDREQSEKWGTAVGKGLLGGFQTLLETARKATKNAIENRNDPAYQSQKYTADYLQHKANKTTDQAEKEWLNQEAAKMRETSEAFKHNDPVPWYSDGMMNLKESRDATQDLVASRKTKAGKLMTQAGLSMLQMAPFLAANVIPGAGQAISLSGMGALAAGQKAGELQMNGTGAGEALARGLVSGGIEAFTEKIPMDSLLKLVKGGGGTNFIKAVAKQAGIEATEESASYTMNWLADKAARDPNAKFSLSDLAENAAIGAISGAAFGAGGHMIGSAMTAGRTPYRQTSPTEDTTPTPTVEEAPRPIQEQPTQESANPLIRASHAQEQMRTQAQEQAKANQDTRAQMQSARERLVQARQALAQREAAWQERAANATEEEVPDLLREQETLLQAERRIQAQEAQVEREDAGQLSKNFGEEAAHIDQRTAGDVSKPSVKAFQWDYPQMHQYYAQAAEALLQDVEYSKAGQFSEKGRGTVVTKSEAMMQAERMGISRADLEKALIAIINDQGQENYATAKKVELVLDEMLSKGYIPNEAGYSANKVDSKVPPNEAYITAKEAIPGAVKRGSFEAYREQNRLALELGEITEEQLYQEWEQGQTLAQSHAQFEPQSQAQTKEAIPVAVNEENSLPEGMGAASKNFAGDFSSWVENTPGDQFHRINESAYQQTEAEQGRAREEIPTMNPYGRLTSKTASTLMNANITPNDFVTKMEDALARGEFSRMVYSDAKATAQVRQKIENVGFQRAKEDWMGEMQNGISSKFNTAMGITLYNNAVNAGDAIAALDIANTMIDYAKDTAQALQGFNLINKMSPEGQLYSITKTVENLNEKARRRSKVDKETGLPKFEDIELDPELVQRFLDAETQEERDSIRKEIYQDIGRKMPATWQDKFDTIRYTMMLANLRTHDRNLGGNAGFMPVRMMKNVVAASMESAFKVNDRTKALINVGSKADRALLQAGWNDFLNVEDLIKNGGKYDEAQSIIRDNQQVFTSPVGKAFQKISDANSWLLDKEDMIFSRPAYAESLAMYLKANKISAVDYMNDTISQESKNKAQEYAILEAQKATYRDLNAFSEFVTRLNRLKHSNNAVERTASYLVEGLLPFKKTPANILVRGVEYSPIGLAKGLTYDLAQVRNGNKTAAEAIDNIAAGLTGTGLLALGGLMFANGLVSAGSTGDDKQDDFNDLRGAQSYALQIGDKSYTLDWLAPEALPFFVGVELKNAYDQREGLNFFQFLDVLKNVADPMLEMSMLQSLNDTIDNIKFSDNGLGAIVLNVLTNYLTQFLPTLGGQIERTGESTRQSTFYDPNSPLPKSLQKLIGKTLNKVPGLEYNQIDYLDAWGRTEETGTPLERFFRNFLSPGYSSTWNSSSMENELQRLYDAGYTDVFPSSVKQSSDFMGGKMTADQWSARQKTQGQEAYRILTQFMQTDTYKNMSDDDKARYIETVYDYANGIGKIAAGEPAEKEAKWIQSAQAGKEKVGLDPSTFASVYAYKRTLENDDSTDDEVVKQGMLEDYINGRSDLNDSQKEYLRDSIKFFKMNPVKADSYQKVKNAGYDNPQEIQALLNAKKEFDTNGNGDINNSELYKGIVGKTSDPVEQEKLYNAYKDKNVTTSWSDFAKTQGAQTAKEEKAQTALNNAVSTEKQASFASSVETNGKDSYVKIYRALMAVDATEAERAAYYDYINSQRGTPWKKDWAHAKQQAIENIAAGK